MFKDATILITGGTGSWGQELTRKLLMERPKEIRIFSRNEYAQVTMARTFHYSPLLTFAIGDVRDAAAVEEACRGVDYVFHLAALKHVPICEWQPEEALKTNVQGTVHVIQGSVKQGVKKVIDVSTDKAALPINFYGMTKSIGEKLMLQASLSQTGTRFVCIRGGNVLGTNGSVVPYFQQLIRERKEITLTSREMTRFFLTISSAITLLLKAAKESVGGETFVMKMRACRILDLAEVMIEGLATEPVSIREIGIRPGEKLHEVLVTSYESVNTYRYSDQYFVILHGEPEHPELAAYRNLEKVPFTQYESNSDLMSKREIQQMLRGERFL